MHNYHVLVQAYEAGFEAYELGLPLEDAWQAYLADGLQTEEEQPITKEEQTEYARGWCAAWIA